MDFGTPGAPSGCLRWSQASSQVSIASVQTTPLHHATKEPPKAAAGRDRLSIEGDGDGQLNIVCGRASLDPIVRRRARARCGRAVHTVLILTNYRPTDFYDRAAEFEAATGATVDITEAPIAQWPGLVAEDAGSTTGDTGPHLFHGYVIEGNWVADLYEVGSLQDLSQYIDDADRWTDLDW